jgi:nucleoside-diphosphate-sugar epimerase
VRLLITGATGFVGRAVLAALPAAGLTVRLLEHRTPVPPRPRSEIVRDDLAEPGPLDALCAGVDSILHLAHHIGADPVRCRAVNTHGTERLLAAAERARVRRVVQLGTAAVYGTGPHRGAAEPAPVSPTSRSRLTAERAVLAYGGTVLRPYLVYGPGDRWVVPAIAAMLRRVPAWIGDGQARLSVIAVPDLAAALLALATGPAPPAPAVHHAAHPEPVTQRELLASVAAVLGLPVPDHGIPYPDYLGRLAGDPAAPSPRQVRMLAVDHWYDTASLWRLTGHDPGPGPIARLAAAAPWYRAHVRVP